MECANENAKSAVGNAIDIANLSYSYNEFHTVLSNVNLKVPTGSRTILIGSNGTGKTTLLRIIAGKSLVKATVLALGEDAYSGSPEGVTLLGDEWANNPVVRRDISVTQLLSSSGGDLYPDRRDKLLDLLDVNPAWHMHEVSSGERRRVQVLLGLIEPFQLLLLDEVTVDLDVLVRRDLLDFLRTETETRNVTVFYATHIFDGLGDWASHVCHLANGTVRLMAPVQEVPELQYYAQKHQQAIGGLGDSPLLSVVQDWLREEFEERKKRRRQPTAKPITSLERKKWDRSYGDKFYNYWGR